MSDDALPTWLEIVRALGAGLGPLLLFLSAVIAAYIAWRTYRQREAADALAYRQRKEADEREELWRRTQWAIDYASHENEEKAGIGLEALSRLVSSPLASGEDRELVQAMLGEVIAARGRRTYTGGTAPGADRPCPRRRFPWACRGE